MEMLGFVNHYRYLGVALDPQLTMEHHVDGVVNKAKPLLYTLAKLRYYVTWQTSVRIYKTYILPIIEFGLFLVDDKIVAERLQKLQNKALCICLHEEKTSPSFP